MVFIAKASLLFNPYIVCVSLNEDSFQYTATLN